LKVSHKRKAAKPQSRKEVLALKHSIMV